VAVTGLEKIVPTLEDLKVLLRLLPVSATGQFQNCYTSFIPLRKGHRLVVYDGWRGHLLQNKEFRDILLCIRCGACLNICPVYGLVGGHAYRSVYPGPIGVITGPFLGERQKDEGRRMKVTRGRHPEQAPSAFVGTERGTSFDKANGLGPKAEDTPRETTDERRKTEDERRETEGGRRKSQDAPRLTLDARRSTLHGERDIERDPSPESSSGSGRRPRADSQLETRNSKLAFENLKLSSLCGACTDICPVKVPIHYTILKLRAAAPKPWWERAAFGLGRLTSRPLFWNAALRLARWTPGWIADAAARPWSRERGPLRPSRESFASLWKKRNL